MAGRYTTLIQDPKARTGVERLRRLRALAELRERLAEDPRAVSFPCWLAQQPQERLDRAAAGLAELGEPALAEGLRALAPRAVKATPVQQLLGLENPDLQRFLEVGQALRAAGPALARRTRELLEAHSELQAEAALPESELAPPGRRRWRVPAVVSGGLFGVIAAAEVARTRLGLTSNELRTRLEDRVRGEVGMGLGFDWGEPLQCHQATPMEADGEPPLGAAPGDLVVRPVSVPTAALVEGLRGLLGEESPLLPVVRDGRLQLVDRRAEVFEARLKALAAARGPKTRAERIGSRVHITLEVLRTEGLAQLLTAHGATLRQAAQGLQLVGLDEASRLLHRVLTRLGSADVPPEDLDWAAQIADLSTLGRVRFALFELALAEALCAADARLFDYLESQRWAADEAW